MVQNDVGPKKFLVQRNFEIKEFWLKTELSFRKIAQRFLIKTNLGKILGPERFQQLTTHTDGLIIEFGENGIGISWDIPLYSN